MYAIVKTGGKQFRAEQDGILIVEKIEGEPGTVVELGEVILLADGDDVTVGSPLVQGAKVSATIVRQAKGPKITGFTYKNKTNQRKRWGHRQKYDTIEITGIKKG